jgi:hypothetical protein
MIHGHQLRTIVDDLQNEQKLGTAELGSHPSLAHVLCHPLAQEFCFLYTPSQFHDALCLVTLTDKIAGVVATWYLVRYVAS